MRWLVLLFCLVAGSALAQGKITFTPDQGPVGTRVQARAVGLPANAKLDFVWASVDANWLIEDTLYKGVKVNEAKRTLTNVVANLNGEATFSFVIPEDFGYVHNLTLVEGNREVARQGFMVIPELSISPRSGPLGTPITIKLTGLGYRFYDRGRHLYYDQKYTGWLTAISTKGTATATIRATGDIGQHLIELINGPRRGYLNGEQSPNFIPAIPFSTKAVFTLTRGKVVLPPKIESQSFAREAASAQPRNSNDEKTPSLAANFRSGTVGSLINFTGAGFSRDASVALSYRTVRGNRIAGGGWEEAEVPLGSYSTDASGQLRMTLPTPDDLEGERVFTARSGEAEAKFSYRITPNVAKFGPNPVKPGAPITIKLKGTGWTSTGNIYTLLMDNSHMGYACGFNSRGDITITLNAPMQRGWHFIDLYPSIYEGKSDAPTATTSNDHFQLPMLNHRDHPGEKLPAFHLAFEVK
ncbi:MAG: hypothetical protein ACKVQK_23200 [Burkholderiales bacterium]